jgi:hypothetical protein
MSREAMQMALDAMMTIRPYEVVDYDQLEASITALRERLAQPEQESVKFCTYPKCQTTAGCAGVCARQNTTPQPSKPWVGLTEEEREFSLHQALRFYDTNAQLLSFIKTVEEKLKEKNT